MSRTLTITISIAAGLGMLAASCGGDTSHRDAAVSGSAEPSAGDGDGTGTDPGDGSSNVIDPGDGDGTGTDPGDGSSNVIDLGRDDVVLTAGLVRFDDCDTLLDHLHSEYSARVGPWGFDRGGWFGVRAGFEDEEMMTEAAVADDGAGGAAAPVEGTDFSGTNVQEAGVDEADIVKTDGRRIYTLSAGQLVVVDAASRTRTGAVAVTEGWGRELFLSGDRLLLISRSTSEAPDGAETVIERIDVSGDVPEIVETISVQGTYISARSVDGTARVILRYDPQWNFPFVYPQSEAGESVAEDANRSAVLNSTLDDWLPRYSVGAADSSTGSQLTSCSDVHAPSVFGGFGVTAVLSVPIEGAFDASESTAVMAPGDTVYASTGSLYVATTRWIDSDEFGGDDDWDTDTWREAWQQRRTSIHLFDIIGAEAEYESSGEVLGVIHNQFSLSEHDGYLRVVTTTSDPWGEESESHVRVLSTDGDQLVEIGSVGDIGSGEQVQSVRFAGDVGYVVTFRQVDPFYTIDLSDPANPAILGELKIPGFSSYLHPIGDSLVLGVGSDADDDGRVTGAKVSLFDVSDLAAPREVAVWTAPDGWNEIGWDHRAFLWWEPESLAVIPVTVWGDWSGAVVLRVADGAIAEVGRVDHVVDGDEPGQTDCRRLAADDLASADMENFSTELEYMIVDGYSAVLACGPGESGITGYECRVNTYLTEEAEHLGLLRGEESASICWPVDQLPVIVRSIVIGDELWTLGVQGWGFDDGGRAARLHANDLQTLERLAALEL